MTRLDESINDLIQASNVDTNHISDGFHTFGELYEHRIALFIALARQIKKINYKDSIKVWKSKLHSDGTELKGWFVMGINILEGEQITYHIPMGFFPSLEDIPTLERAPEWDGHDSNEVVKRLHQLK